MESVKTHKLCAVIIPFKNSRKGFSDLTGSFSHKLSHGNLYFMVVYYYDSNAILDKPIKNRKAATIRDAFIKTHKVLKSRGIDPKV